MPAEYRIDSARGVVLSTARGVLTDMELLAHQRQLRSDPAFRPDLNQIFDFTDVTDARLTAKAVRQLADRNPFGAGARRVFVVRTPVLLGLMRMYQLLSDFRADELRVVAGTVAEARALLGLDEDAGQASAPD